MQHNRGVPFLELTFGEGPGDLLEDDSCSGGGIIDDRDLVDVIGVDEVLDGIPGIQDSRLELGEEEVVGLA